CEAGGGAGKRPDGEAGRRPRGSEPPLVVVGSSTGGPKALMQLFTALPKDFPSPVVVVQHMPAGFTQALAARLNQISELEIAEAVQIGRASCRERGGEWGGVWIGEERQ